MPAHEDDYGFSGALVCIKQGQCVSRRGWNGKGQYIQLHPPAAGSEMTLPFISIHTVHGDRVPWLASQTDLLALDWYEVETDLLALDWYEVETDLLALDWYEVETATKTGSQ